MFIINYLALSLKSDSETTKLLIKTIDVLLALVEIVRVCCCFILMSEAKDIIAVICLLLRASNANSQKVDRHNTDKLEPKSQLKKVTNISQYSFVHSWSDYF